MDSVSLLWSNIMEPQHCNFIMKLLKYNLHLTESDLIKQHTHSLHIQTQLTKHLQYYNYCDKVYKNRHNRQKC